MTAITSHGTSILTTYPFPLTNTNKTSDEKVKKEETKPITVKTIDFASYGVITPMEIVLDGYNIHPISFILSGIFSIFGLLNFVTFILNNSYLLHPYISLGLFVGGIGILTTMLVAGRAVD